jgi:hypothetical protein
MKFGSATLTLKMVAVHYYESEPYCEFGYECWHFCVPCDSSPPPLNESWREGGVVSGKDAFFERKGTRVGHLAVLYCAVSVWRL